MKFTLIPNKSLTLISSDSTVYTSNSDTPNWFLIMEALKSNDENKVIELMSIRHSVTSFTKNTPAEGTITINNGEVFYKNTEKLTGLDVRRILEFIKNGIPAVGMIKFLENKMNNPSKRSIDVLYKFLENKGMPITPQGTFLGYKGIKEDYSSINLGREPLLKGIRLPNGSIDNHIGQEIEMERNYVNDDFTVACAAGGLHVGDLMYAKKWAGSVGRVVIVEVNPADVVSVPEADKLRCRRYKVVGELNDKSKYLRETYTEEFSDDKPQEIKVHRDGYLVGYKDGKNHKVKKHINETDSYSIGYIQGYKDGRRGNPNIMESCEVSDSDNYNGGYKDGLNDGKRHKKKSYYDYENDGSNIYITGYLDGYRESRSKEYYRV